MHESCQCVWFCYLSQCKTKCKEDDSWPALMSSVMCGTACAVKEGESPMWQPLKPSTVHLLEHAELSSEPAKQTLFSEVLYLYSRRWMILPANLGKSGQGLLLGGWWWVIAFSPVLSHLVVLGSERAALWCLAACWGKPLQRWRACLLFLWRWN